MRAFDEFILSMQKRRGKGTDKQREKDERSYPSVSERSRDNNPDGRQ